jgi:hypothetical protein
MRWGHLPLAGESGALEHRGPGLGSVDVRCHRARRRYPVAGARGPGPLQTGDHGTHGGDGTADLGFFAGPGSAVAGPEKCRTVPPDGAEVVGSLEQAFTYCETEPETWVIGGAQIYLLALPHATRCEVTEVDIDLPRDDDDALAPVLDETWLAETGEWQVSRTGLRYRFHSYCRP